MAGESERTKEPESQRARDERAREGERGRASERASERERERERERAITFKCSWPIASLSLIDFLSHARAHSLSLLISCFLSVCLSPSQFAVLPMHIHIQV